MKWSGAYTENKKKQKPQYKYIIKPGINLKNFSFSHPPFQAYRSYVRNKNFGGLVLSILKEYNIYYSDSWRIESN